MTGERVLEEVLQQPTELVAVPADGGQPPHFHLGRGLEHPGPKVVHHVVGHRVEVDLLEGGPLATDPGIGQEAVDQTLHTAGPVHGVADELARLIVECVGVAALEQLQVARHHAEGLLQVVRGRVRELFEVGVRALQLPRAPAQLALGLDTFRHVLDGQQEQAGRTLVAKQRTSVHAHHAASALREPPVDLEPLEGLVLREHGLEAPTQLRDVPVAAGEVLEEDADRFFGGRGRS